MNNDNDFISIGEAASLLGVSVPTLRRLEKNGQFLSKFRTIGNHRRYNRIDVLSFFNKEKRINVAYARVSSHDQKKDLETQKTFLENHLKENKVENIELISDLGSGLNYKKKGLKKLLNMLLSGEINTLYLTHKDRLLRFGSELVFNIAQQFGTKLYGSRSHKNKPKTT